MLLEESLKLLAARQNIGKRPPVCVPKTVTCKGWTITVSVEGRPPPAARPNDKPI